MMADLRELFILVLALLIGFSLLRAFFVILRRRKGQVRLSIDKSIAQSMEIEEPEAEEFDELPNGGARVVSAAGSGQGGHSEHPDGGVDEEHIPVLTDTVVLSASSVAGEPSRFETAGAGELASHPETPEAKPQSQRAPVPTPKKQKQNWKAEIHAATSAARSHGDDADLDLGAVSMTAGERIGQTPKSSATLPPSRLAPAPATSGPDKPSTATTGPLAHPAQELRQAAPASARAPETRTQAETRPRDDSPEQIIAIHVLAREGKAFNGLELWQYLLAANLRFDEMKIFSKLENHRENARPVFRVANVVNPGTFDADNIEEFTTPGVSMFMVLPAPIDNMRAFEQMLTAARGIARTFDGRLLDSARQELTRQSIEQARGSIREFEISTYGPSSVNGRI